MMRRFYSQFRLSLRLLTKQDIVLVALLVLSIVIVVEITNSEFKGYAANVSASFAFATIIRFSDVYRLVLNRTKFVSFFGTKISENNFYIIYPEFQLDHSIRDLAKCNSFHTQELFIKRHNYEREERHFRIDMPFCTACNDVRAMMELAALFGKYVGSPPKISPDSDWDKHQGDSIIAIGFSSNIATYDWLRLAKDAVKRVDDIENERYREFVRIISGDKGAIDFRSGTDEEIGIIAKFCPDPAYPNIIWFICAGVGPEATIGCAVFLARKWSKMFDLFGSADFILVTKTPIGITNYTKPVFALQSGNSKDVGELL